MSINAFTRLIFYFLFLVMGYHQASAQEHPLSKHDSALVVKYEAEYKTYLEEHANIKEATRYLNEIAFIYWEHNQYKKAIEYYKISADLNEKIENENGIAMINNNLGMLHADIMDYEKSYDYFMLTLAARRSKNEKIGMISAMINLSVVLNNLERYEESIQFLQESLNLARGMKDVDQMKSCYGMLSETYEKAGDVKQSIYYFNLYKTFTQMAQKEKIDQIMEDYSEEKLLKAQLEEENKKHKEALLERKKELESVQRTKQKYELELSSYDSITRSLYDDLNQKELRLEVLTKESQISQLKAQQEIQEERIERENEKRKLQIAITVSLAMLIVLFFILRSKRKTKKWAVDLEKKNEVIEEQREELRELNSNLQELVEQRTEALKKANDKLSEFIFSNSHIIRKPVANIKGIVNLMSKIEVNKKNKQLLDMLGKSNSELDDALSSFNESLTLNESFLKENQSTEK
ncbi:tetratricopeptide repeat protein [Reichenbachiella ulvae]|uniref:Tetratricopeptide repeat protein n=1 Tax=Reichenbachiella ulvae TaxID=2980104 RepID=A0ABT3CNY2_9BACT|nr:tetratricopeptide repeat protein [Reichenbachiella ulvae]MCV9385451.1 tetratricopeptide repeat protein [Reichenbachiella ulvae]